MTGVDFKVGRDVDTDYKSKDVPVEISVRTAVEAGGLACAEQSTVVGSQHNGYKVVGVQPDVHYLINPNGKNETKKVKSSNNEGFFDQSSTEAYFIEISKFPILTKEDEVRLARIINVGKNARLKLEDESMILDEAEKSLLLEEVERAIDARTDFIQANLKLVVYFAKKFKTEKVSILDKIQFGNAGLMHALDMFDPERGFKFSTYAGWWIRQYIARGIGTTDRNISLPNWIQDTLYLYNRVSESFEQTRGRTGTPDEIIEAYGLDPRKTKIALEHASDASSFNRLRLDDSDTELGDMVADGTALLPEDHAVVASNSADIDKMLGDLEQEERKVLSLYFGLNMGQSCKVDEIVQILGISDNKVLTIMHRAFSKLRHPSSDYLLSTAEWREKAYCRGLGYKLFFLLKGESLDETINTCEKCTVSSECLGYSLNNGEKHGMWGGKSERQRRKLRKPNN